MSKIKTCIVCGKKYEYCGHCDKGGQENRWKTNYCSENCRDIFNIISKYVNHHISIDDAKQELVEKDLGINIKNSLAKYCGEIMTHGENAKEEIVKETTEEVEESIVEEIVEKTTDEESEDTEEEPETVSDTIPSFVKSEFKPKRKRRYIPTSK